MQYLFFNPRQGVISVKRGFSWPAFFFGAFWAMAHRMWVPQVAVLLPLDIVFWFLTGYTYLQGDGALAVTVGLAYLAVALVRGRHGNAWLAASLQRRGYAESSDLLRMA